MIQPNLNQYNRHEDTFINDLEEKVSIFTHSQVVVFLIILASLFKLTFAYLILSYLWFFVVFNACYWQAIYTHVNAPPYYNRASRAYVEYY